MNSPGAQSSAFEIRRPQKPDVLDIRGLGEGTTTAGIDEWAVRFEVSGKCTGRAFLIVENLDPMEVSTVELVWERAGFRLAETDRLDPWHPTHQLAARASRDRRRSVGFGQHALEELSATPPLVSGSNAPAERLLGILKENLTAALSVRVDIRPDEAFNPRAYRHGLDANGSDSTCPASLVNLCIQFDVPEASDMSMVDLLYIFDHAEPWKLDIVPVADVSGTELVACDLTTLDRVLPLPGEQQSDSDVSWWVGDDRRTGVAVRLRNDLRFRHVRILGKTGTGKSVYMRHQWLARFCYDFVDPTHSGIVGPRFETWLRSAAVLHQHTGVPHSLLDLTTPFTDAAVRTHLLKDVEDPLILEFWEGEFAKTSDFHGARSLDGSVPRLRYSASPRSCDPSSGSQIRDSASQRPCEREASCLST